MNRLSLRRAVAIHFFLGISAAVASGTDSGQWSSYAGQRVVRVTTRAAEELEFIQNLGADVWSCFGPAIGSFDVRVTLEQLARLADSGIPYQVVVDDLQSLVDAERKSIARAAQGAGGWFQTFRTYAEINERLDFLGQTYPQLARVTTLGESIEGRDIRVIRITGPDAEGNPRDARPAFVIEGTQHAREWIAPVTVMYLADRLLAQYASDARIRAVVNAVDLYIVPAVNPDGYEYTWTTDRYWRKNRRVNEGSTCLGVDLNRNWEVGWGGIGSNDDPCSDVYHGPRPWTEPEITVVRDLAQSLVGRLGAYLDFHSFGQLVLSPWQYTLTPPPDSKFLNGYGQLMSDAIFSVHGRRYVSGQGSQILYIAAGTAHDFAYGALGIPAWGIELRGGDFVLPPEEIVPTGEENLEAILRLCETLLSP